MLSPDKILWTAKCLALPQRLWDQLKNQGYDILMMDNGMSVDLSKVKKLSPKLWVMEMPPGQNGTYQYIEKVRRELPGLPLLLISGEPSVEEAVQTIKAGASEYLPATVSQDHLSAILTRYLAANQATMPRNVSKRKGGQTNSAIVARDPAMKKVLRMAEKVAPRTSTVLIQGESGCGKEVLAKYIHMKSKRSDGPFVALNCAALPENLLESELFGHEKGAFTGAIARKQGKFEVANGGTLLLDEVSEMALPLQAKLLRALQEKQIDRVGGALSIPVDVRVIATTNRDLEKETKEGNFRLDLYYRLNVIPLYIPPLRERTLDIVPLAKLFLEKQAKINEEPVKELTKDAEELLRGYHWPGNVRELENLMERAALFVESQTITGSDLSEMIDMRNCSETEKVSFTGGITLKEMEKKMIFQALCEHGGNRTHAARVLGISVRTLRNKLHEYKKDLEALDL